MGNVTRLLVISLILIGVKATFGDHSVESAETVEELQRATNFVIQPEYQPTNTKNPLGKGFYLPNIDLFSDLTGGVPIFDTIDSQCLSASAEDRHTKQTVDFYVDTQSYYNKIADSRSLATTIKGKYTMGTTLGVKTSSISAGSTDVSGNSLRMWVYTQTNALLETCYPNSPLSNAVTTALNNLPLTITNPRDISSWAKYRDFFSDVGSHVVTKTRYGSSIRHWAFAKKIKNYSENQFVAAACVNFEGLSKVGQLGVDACTSVTDDQTSTVSSYEMLFNGNVQGGTDATRDALATSRTQELLEQLMNEGRESPAPIDYEYEAIWNVIKMKFPVTDLLSQQMRAKAENLRQFYEGFKDFGCSELEVNGVRMRYFRATTQSSTLIPQYECWMESEGCRSNNDCNAGAWQTVTYCYGSTCMEHRSPAFGNKAETAVARTSKSGSYRSGVNRTCYYKSSAGAGYCRNPSPYYEAKKIWP